MTDRQYINWWVLGLPLLGIGLLLMLNLIIAPTPAYAISSMPAPHPLSLRDGDGSTGYLVGSQDAPWIVRPSNVLTYFVYLPLIVARETCQPIPDEGYASLSVNPPPSDRPAAEHADLNLALRGYELTNAFKGLVDYGSGGDPGAPQLPGLFADNRTGVFTNVYQVYDWNWGCNCRGDLLTNWPVTLAGLATTPDETIHVPDSGYSIGSGYEVLVLYASAERITLKYTRDDNVVQGYTLHVEDVCVEPRLLALYQAANSAGRGQLPALRAGQAFGRAMGGQVGVAIRDNGTFMDPRSRNDWWRGR
ncbi:MAG: hypothetical protein Kow0063_33590 [Anaerolineae bacterium]